MTAVAESQVVTRLVGRYIGTLPGPKMLVTTMMHGNEPAGRDAALRVLARFSRGDLELTGEFVVLLGNTRAARSGVRFVDKDLNRQWTPERVEFLRRSTPEQRTDAEDEEAFELLQLVDAELVPSKAGGYFLDLHTTSAEGVPFLLFGDTLRNRSFAGAIPLTRILGLEEQLDGTLLEHVGSYGFVSVGCEGGQHEEAGAVDNHEAFLWMALEAAGMLRRSGVDFESCRQRLIRAREGRPSIVEVRYRHAIRPQERFHMRPGFTNLDPVKGGTLLARDASGEIRARWDGWLVMPLYQGKGEDGFFLASEVRPFWLAVSAALRKLRLVPLLQLLPGVSVDAERADTLVVDTRVARWCPLDIFHLFGFRKLRWQGSVLLVSRRPHDLKTPW